MTLIPSTTIFGEMTGELNSLLQAAKPKVARIKAAIAAAGGGTAIETDPLFMVVTGQGGTFYQLIIDLDIILNAATGAMSDAALAQIDAGD